MIPFPAPSGGRFPGSFLNAFSFPVTAEFNSQVISLRAQFNCNKMLHCLFFGFLCYLNLRSSDVTHQLLCIIINTFGQNGVEDSQNLTGHRYH